jgi:hypothetical protein
VELISQQNEECLVARTMQYQSVTQCTKEPMVVHIIDPCTSKAWSEFVNTHPNAGIFHHPAWMTMLRDTYGYQMLAVCIQDGTRIIAGIPFADVRSFITGKRWVSLPFSDYCEPLLPADNPQCIDILMRFLKAQQGVNTNKIEIRWSIYSTESIYTTHNFVLHTLELDDDPDEMFSRMDKQAVRNRVAKTKREGIVVRECKTLQEFHNFYALQLLTRKRLGVPAQPAGFFDAIWKYIIEPGLGFALISYKEDMPIGGGVFLTFGSTVWFKYSASDFRYKSIFPTHACVWEAIQRSCQKGYRIFDFGRSDMNNTGLRLFKSGWGTVEHALGYSTIADEPPQMCATSKFDVLSNFVIRHSPALVCKVSGSILYKHFA